MCASRPLEEWATEVSLRLPGLSNPQAFVLALYSLGMVLANSSGRTAVAAILAPLLGMKERSVVHRLREWGCEAKAKKGDKRQALDGTACFPGLLKWVLSLWVGTQLAIALDATTPGAQFSVLASSIVDRGGAIPVAWTILKAGQQHAWNQEGVRMLKSLKGELPTSMTVIVLTDRGLYSRKLFNAILSHQRARGVPPENNHTYIPIGHPFQPSVARPSLGNRCRFYPLPSSSYRLDEDPLLCESFFRATCLSRVGSHTETPRR